MHKIQPHFRNGRFYNHEDEKSHYFLWPTIKILFEWLIKRTHPNINEISSWTLKYEHLERTENLAITWLGHSTFLIQIGNYNILTDPIFGNLPFFKRILPSTLLIDKLPAIDFVLISHNHPDHMDKKTLLALKNHKGIRFLVPYGDKKWFDKYGFSNVIENKWWNINRFDSSYSSLDIDFIFLPSYHWSQRGIFDYNKSLWGSWMIKYNDKHIYFAGDTAYSKHFKCISTEFPKIDIAIMPIAPCEPNDLLSSTHINAEQAGKAFLDLNALNFIPMHWGTYNFGTDDFLDPIRRISKWWNSNINPKDFKFLHLLKNGQRLSDIFSNASNILNKKRYILST
jgi:L-ascorbate metabolism protein UlaG (beta-lactamase superfamily)